MNPDPNIWEYVSVYTGSSANSTAPVNVTIRDNEIGYLVIAEGALTVGKTDWAAAGLIPALSVSGGIYLEPGHWQFVPGGCQLYTLTIYRLKR